MRLLKISVTLLQKYQKDTLVIIDEAYIDFVTSVDVPTARALLDEFPNVAIMRTFQGIWSC